MVTKRVAMLWFGLYLLLGCVRAQTKLELQSTEAQRVSLLRSSKASWDELILKNGGEYCYTLVNQVPPELVTYKDTFYVEPQETVEVIWRVERVDSNGRVTHPKPYGETYNQIYRFCLEKVAPTTAASASSLIIETNSQNLLIRCGYTGKSNQTWTGYHELTPVSGSCSSAFSWMVPLFICIPLVFTAALFGLVAFLHKINPGKLIPSEGELESFLSNEPHKKPEATESKSPSNSRLVINETSAHGFAVLDDDSGPDEDDIVYHLGGRITATPMPKPQPKPQGTLGELPKRPPAQTANFASPNPYYVASPTPLSFNGGMSISPQPVTTYTGVTPINPVNLGTGNMFSGLVVNDPVPNPQPPQNQNQHQGGLFAGLSTNI